MKEEFLHGLTNAYFVFKIGEPPVHACDVEFSPYISTNTFVGGPPALVVKDSNFFPKISRLLIVLVSQALLQAN
jgi:hypothetical protein